MLYDSVIRFLACRSRARREGYRAARDDHSKTKLDHLTRQFSKHEIQADPSSSRAANTCPQTSTCRRSSAAIPRYYRRPASANKADPFGVLCLEESTKATSTISGSGYVGRWYVPMSSFICSVAHKLLTSGTFDSLKRLLAVMN